mmetsp:Transcript_11851/g.26314  ORF Transcript_11851/g.26314 Transcript_11851/m.26314 type:complete len:103 (+) Transcript_11851:1786-2094(+)
MAGSARMKNWQIAKLDQLGFHWGLDDDWLTWWELLKGFKEEKGHFPSHQPKYHGGKLGKWVYTQRRLYRRLQNGERELGSVKMSDWRIAKLNELGFDGARLK